MYQAATAAGRCIIRDLPLSALFLGTASIIGYGFRVIGFPEVDIILVYHLAVVVTAWLTSGFAYGVAGSLAAAFLFNYLFIEPRFTFAVNDPRCVVTFVIMTITALITSGLTSHARAGARRSMGKEAETRILYDLTSRLRESSDIHAIAGAIADAVGDCFDCRVDCLCWDENGAPESFFIERSREGKHTRREIPDEALARLRSATVRTSFDDGREFYGWRISGTDGTLGLIRMPAKTARTLTDSRARILRSIMDSAVLAMDRVRFIGQRARFREETMRERCRGNLLRAISHDLRTPLTVILGASSAILENGESFDGATVVKLLGDVRDDSRWLIRMVENLLSVTRVDQDAMKVTKIPEAAEEIMAGAAARVRARFPDRAIAVKAPDELLIVPMDGTLIIQVIINLIENAVKNSRDDSTIELEAKRDGKEAIFEISDEGIGIDERDIPGMFEGKPRVADLSRGMGIGLSICDSIIRAHDGMLEASNRETGGAVFRFTLPLGECETDEQ